MTYLVLNTDTRLTDDLERQLVRSMVAEQMRIKPLDLIKATLIALRNGAVNVLRFVEEVNDSMDEARRASIRQSGGFHW
jgi:F0F1-type ATP synthase assembly protein I